MKYLNITRFTRIFRNGLHADPVRDWSILFGLSLITFVGLVVWNVWTFETVAGGGTIGAPCSFPTCATPTVNRSSITAVQEVFNARAAEETKYVSGVYRYLDPSQSAGK